MATATMDSEPMAGLRDPEVADSLLRFLSRPESYAEPTATVSIVETHISKVFLTDSTVYKLKKSVRFPFLDYSTLDQRLAACREEVRLNRRLAPNVYLGIVPIVRGSGGRLQFGGEGEVLDYCVQMRRLPAERMLDRMIREGTATRQHVERLLDVLVPFYRTAARGPEIERYATAEAIAANARQNLALIDSAVRDGGDNKSFPRAMLQRVRASQLQFLKLSADLFAERIRSGHVCEGHGDLRPEHACMLEPPIVFDCVEFSLPLRAGDVVSELAFLAMELDFLGLPELAHALIEGYGSRTGNRVPESLASFYKSYRACVRAKVELLRAAQQPESAARGSCVRARRYLQLASFYGTAFYRPKLFVMVGATGTGKSAVADSLADALGLEVLRTDAIRHELAGHREPDAGLGEGIYSDSFTYWTYETLFDRAESLLRESVSVVLDGTFRSSGHRDRAIELAHGCGADIQFLYCRCPAELARARIAARLARREQMSDARPELHELQRRELDFGWHTDRSSAIELATAKPVSESVAHVIERLAESRHAAHPSG